MRQQSEVFAFSCVPMPIPNYCQEHSIAIQEWLALLLEDYRKP